MTAATAVGLAVAWPLLAVVVDHRIPTLAESSGDRHPAHRRLALRHRRLGDPPRGPGRRTARARSLGDPPGSRTRLRGGAPGDALRSGRLWAVDRHDLLFHRLHARPPRRAPDPVLHLLCHRHLGRSRGRLRGKCLHPLRLLRAHHPLHLPAGDSRRDQGGTERGPDVSRHPHGDLHRLSALRDGVDLAGHRARPISDPAGSSPARSKVRS